MFTYKGYTAEMKIDQDTRLIVGQVLDIKDSITFHGSTVDEAERELRKSIDAYLKFCEELGQKPDKPFSGKLPFRTNPRIHREIFLAAAEKSKSINAWMEEELIKALQYDRPRISKSIDKLRENNNISELLERLIDLVRIDGSLEEENFIGALENCLIGLDAVRPFLKDGEQSLDLMMDFIRRIESFFLDNDCGHYVVKPDTSDNLFSEASSSN